MTQDLRITKGNETKDRILAASMKIIAEEGIEGLSAKKIADLLGISKSNIFHHFGSVDEVLNVIFENILDYLVKPVKSHQGPDLKVFLLFLGESIYSLSEEEKISYSVLLNFYNSCLYNEKYRAYLLKTKDEMIDAIATQLSRYSSQRKEKLLIISEMIIMTLDGYGLHFLLESDIETFEKIWTLQIDAWQSLLN
ncbi:TetR/AcrR family transcriptional regulator [Alkaliphilus peptidifermentans]|uniref:Transcriptional regulator, TetR family n=1 Tax=Alkaliphilus peptidifermentans DSM 18978 TaxID=1120976 RepID=A0A1G5E7M6_9FIRM|nr:TetR/AcrR family transcriptional regulator [Alkaliphilus peptidifermentans]SCY22915.1 transcriptional regulator, TetR family [Alkaliphilus peptidifermentans DSM 18978]